MLGEITTGDGNNAAPVLFKLGKICPLLINKNFRNIDVGSLEHSISFKTKVVSEKCSQPPANRRKIKNKF